ncbi:MAG: hypothetical protein ACTMIG_13695 [Corynebacterium variabile]|uniref:hypothetical protein n=1 Tax=Corynebacterium variabile TaxID=1727 RepID=UPI003F92C3B4
MSKLTPYDTGERLEPVAWVRGGTTSPDGLARPAEDDDFGRVDFDLDDGTTLATVYLMPVDTGYEMHIQQHGEDYLAVLGANEPPPRRITDCARLEPEYRSRQMMMLSEGLAAVGKEFRDHVWYHDEGEPLFSFDPGHFVFLPYDRDGSHFAIEERFERGTDWEDEDRVPLGWTWVDYQMVPEPDGTTTAQLVAEGATTPADIDRLIDRARTWAQQCTDRVRQAETEGITRPHPGTNGLTS